MKLLVLGGTRFLGRHLVQQALDAGHQVTLLHRGQSASGIFPQAEHLLADRDKDLSPLHGRSWDAVVDTSCYLPRQVHAVAAALGSRVGQYQLVSSISVYADGAARGSAPAGEDAPLQALADPTVETLDNATYGGLKVLCEQAARQHFGARCLVSRPGLLVGPFDPTGRFTWWVQRFLRAADDGRPVLAPGDPAAPSQCLDARDAAAWMLLHAERGTATGDTVNLAGPAQPTTLQDVLEAGRAALAPAAALAWVDDTTLLQHGVAPWTGLPLWLPLDVARGHRVDIGRGLAGGLQCRPLVQTFADTAAWVRDVQATGGDASPTAAAAADAAGSGSANGGLARPAVGITPAQEQSLLAAAAAAG